VKVLFICHRFPFPPKRGGKIRPFNVIRHLQQRHEVTVASIVRTPEEAREGAGLAAHCSGFLMERISPVAALWRMLRALPTRVPSSMGFFHSPRLARRIERELAGSRYDLIFVHCSSVAHYVAGVPGIPRLLDFGDMDSQKWLAYGKTKPLPLSLGYGLEGWKLQREEAELAREFDSCTCTTRAELQTLESLVPGVRAGWFPNGVDTERFRPDDAAYEPHTISFLGRMDYFPNQQCMFEFCRSTLPLLRERLPGIRLQIVGASPSRRVRRLGRLTGVTVTGSVPEVQPFVRRSALTVAPLAIARGTQNKILESLAMGVPVVCSEAAAGGVNVVPGEHLLVCRSPRDYAEAILRLLERPDERRRFAVAGRERMVSHHSWESSMRLLDRIIDDCLSGRRGPAVDERVCR